MQNQLSNQLVSNFSLKIIEIEDLKQLRKLCTEGVQKQNNIAQIIIPHMSQFITIIYQLTSNSRDEKRQTFFLQLLTNMITGNPSTSIKLFQQLNQIDHNIFSQTISLFNNTQKNQRILLTFIYNFLVQLQNSVLWQNLMNNKNLINLILFALNQIHSQQQSTFEWRTFIFVILFNWQKPNEISTIQTFITFTRKPHDYLTMLSILLQKVIDSRCTSTLIKGYSPQIQHIIQMYKQDKTKKILNFVLNKNDIDFLINKFKNGLQDFKKQIREIVQGKQDKTRICFEFQLLTDIVSILGNILFLGGYNNKVQVLMNDIILSVLNYLEIVYLVFKLTDKQFNQRKVEVVNSNEQEIIISQLSKILQIQVNFTQIQTISESIYTVEVFALTLKLLTNFIHINKEGIKTFQNNDSYLYMIMNLTKISSTQPTMRQWSIMFLRNSCQISQIIQDKISQLKVDLKSQ